MGLNKLVTTKVFGEKTYGAINWRGKTPEKVLRMPRTDIRQLRPIAASIEPLSLYSYRFWHKQGWKITPADAHTLRRMSDGWYFKQLLETANGLGTESEIVKYLLKQSRRPDALATYHDATYALTEWRDYLHSYEELGIPLDDPQRVFPPNLHKAHDKLALRVRMKRDETLNQQIAARLEKLESYTFADKQFFIRAAKSSIELFEEGKALCHCVANYTGRYATGKTNLFVLRLVNDPNTPLCTVEVINEKVVQARGYKNRTLNREEQEFLERFVKNLVRGKTLIRKAATTPEILAVV